MDNFKMAKFSRDFDYIVDCDGKRVEINDPKVVHCINQHDNHYNIRFGELIYKSRGFNVRQGADIDRKLVYYAKKYYTGRECLKLRCEGGSIYHDIMENRRDDEITVYDYTQEKRSCQCGAWPVVFETLAKRYHLKNVLFTSRVGKANNYLGQGPDFAMAFELSAILSDILIEAEAAVKCIAADRQEAEKTFDQATDKLIINAAGTNIVKTITELKKWADTLKGIRLDVSVADVPKVFLLSSGGAAGYKPLIEYFYGRKILPKFIESNNYVYFMVSEDLRRFHSSFGLSGEDFFNRDEIKKLIEDADDEVLKKMGNKALESVVALEGITWLESKLRKTAAASGLIYDFPNKYIDQLESGGKKLPPSVYHPATDSVGKLSQLIRSDVVDGIVRVGVFGCQTWTPAKVLSQSFTRNSDIPYTQIQIEGPWLSVNQKRVLENIGIQATRRKQAKLRAGCESKAHERALA